MKSFWHNTLIAIWLPLQATLTGCTGTEDCSQPLSDNLLENPRFEVDERGRHEKWGYSQHAGRPAYRVTAEDGTLTISKFDEQSWFYFAQKVKIPDRGGQHLRFSAEIKLDMAKDPLHAFEQGGGLSLKIRGTSNNRSNRLLLSSLLDHEPRLGKTDWVPVAVTVVVPPGAETVTAGFLHQANGTLEVRNPGLHWVRESCGEKTVPK
jgi:hypothetical protein